MTETRDGSTQVVIPGKKGGLFDGCEFNLLMEFSADYPSKAPVVKFVPEIWHLNCWKGGRVCLNILNEPDGTWHGQWSASITIKEILMAVQHLLDNPFPAGARPDVQALYERDRPSRAAGVQMRPV